MRKTMIFLGLRLFKILFSVTLHNSATVIQLYVIHRVVTGNNQLTTVILQFYKLSNYRMKIQLFLCKKCMSINST